MLSALKTNALLLDEDDEKKVVNHIKHDINIQNTATYYSIANSFKIFSLSKLLLDYMERCFTMVVDSHNFLELGDMCVAKILSSNKLNVDTELEVLYAAVTWLNYNINERMKFAKYVLLKIRHPLISDHALKDFFSNTSYFNSADDRTAVVNEVLQIKESVVINNSDTYYTNRYYSQKKFSIFLCGGCKSNSGSDVTEFSNLTFKIDMDTLKCREDIPMKSKRMSSKAVCIRGEVYVYGGYDENIKAVEAIEKYSLTTNSWKKVGEIYDDRNQFCCCALTTRMFIIGGILQRSLDNRQFIVENSCVAFDTVQEKCIKISDLRERRLDAACTVFEGKIIVLGGFNKDHSTSMKGVEAYDHVADEWTQMPDMIQGRARDHRSVAIQNKMFVFGGGDSGQLSCEVFDSTCRKFVYLKSFPNLRRFWWPKKAFAVGNQIVAYYEKYILAYNVEIGEWLEKSCKVLDVKDFTFAKVPELKAII